MSQNSTTAARNKLRVCFVVGEFPPFIGGIGDYTDRLAGAMSRAGVDTTVLTLADGASDGEPRPFTLRREIPSFTMRDRRKLIDLVAGFDVVNLQYPGVRYGRSPMVNVFPALLRRAAPNVCTTTTIHDCRVMRWRWRLRTWPLVNGVDGIIHVDPDDWAYIKAWCTFGAPPHACIPIASNVEVLPCTVDDRKRWRQELGIGKDETAIAYFGVIYPHKGLDELLDAHASLRAKGHKLKTVIIGDFDRDEPWRAPLEARFAEPGVIWARGASLTRVSECLHACDLAALPFHSGTSTNRSSMLAALGHGLPTVTTDGPATPKEIGQLFDLVLVPPKDAAALEAGIESVLADSSLAGRLRASAKRPTSAVTWDAVAARHVEFFQQLVASRKTRGAA